MNPTNEFKRYEVSLKILFYVIIITLLIYSITDIPLICTLNVRYLQF